MFHLQKFMIRVGHRRRQVEKTALLPCLSCHSCSRALVGHVAWMSLGSIKFNLKVIKLVLPYFRIIFKSSLSPPVILFKRTKRTEERESRASKYQEWESLLYNHQSYVTRHKSETGRHLWKSRKELVTIPLFGDPSIAVDTFPMLHHPVRPE